jgi:hypothetical protein
MTTNQPNLRRDARVDAKVPVVLRRGGGRVFDLWTSDVSFRGLFLKTSELPPLRSLVQLKVVLPHHTFDTHAMCVHLVDGVGVGLQFWGLSGADRNAWDAFVRREIERRTPPKRKRSSQKMAAQKVTIATPHPSMSEQPTPSGIRVAPQVEAPRESKMPETKKPASG